MVIITSIIILIKMIKVLEEEMTSTEEDIDIQEDIHEDPVEERTMNIEGHFKTKIHALKKRCLRLVRRKRHSINQ